MGDDDDDDGGRRRRRQGRALCFFFDLSIVLLQIERSYLLDRTAVGARSYRASNE